MQYCGHLYSSVLRLWTWWGHRDQYIMEVEYIGVLQTLNSLILYMLDTPPPDISPTNVRPVVLLAALYAAQHYITAIQTH